jgi:hypothetical protein
MEPRQKSRPVVHRSRAYAQSSPFPPSGRPISLPWTNNLLKIHGLWTHHGWCDANAAILWQRFRDQGHASALHRERMLQLLYWNGWISMRQGNYLHDSQKLKYYCKLYIYTRWRSAAHAWSHLGHTNWSKAVEMECPPRFKAGKTGRFPEQDGHSHAYTEIKYPKYHMGCQPCPKFVIHNPWYCDYASTHSFNGRHSPRTCLVRGGFAWIDRHLP